MEKILVEDLIQYKMLPFDVFNEKGTKLISAGEILTSGKLLRISQCEFLYKKNPLLQKSGMIAEQAEKNIKESPKRSLARQAEKSDPGKELFSNDNIINNKSKIPTEFQVSMKTSYADSIYSFKSNENKESIDKINQMKTRILSEVGSVIDEIKYSSQLKLLGSYYNTHALNTAIFAAALGYKMEFDPDNIEILIQAALLHDIGKTKFPAELLEKTKLSSKECKILEKHTLIGFKILKEEMKMPEEICLVALEHHENQDGSGYPYGISGEQISEMSSIVGLCSLFDNLTSGKTKHKVRNTKDALRVLLEFESNKFPPELLYKFVNMFKYNDLSPFEEMVR